MRKIIHIDMDCFYAAVEMRENPNLKDRPIAVGGSADQRGVLTTANYPARQFGLHSAMPTAQALKLCPGLILLPVRMDLYKAVSKEIRLIFERYTSIIEPLSLDEAYLDVTSCTQHHGSATLIAQAIRQDIFDELQLTASAGVAPVKFLAKIASDIQKPNGLTVIKPDEIESFIKTLPLKKIPGVGKVTAEKLAKLNLHTCEDIHALSIPELVHHFGKFGHVLWERSHGIDDREVSNTTVSKSVSTETTINNDIYSWDECLSIIDELYDDLIIRLKRVQDTHNIAKQGIKFKFSDFKQTTREHVWPELNKVDLIELAKQTWDERRKGRGVRLIGLSVTLLEPTTEKQLTFPWY